MKIPPEFKEEPKSETSVWSTLTTDAFFDAIKEVIKIEPLTPKHTAIYIFKFDFGDTKGSIEINVSDFLRGYRKFEDLFFSNFDIPLPSKLKDSSQSSKTSEWNKFVQICAQICTKVPPTESIEWIECDRFLDIVAGFQILEEDRKHEWGRNSGADNVLLKKDYNGTTYYGLKSKDVAELFQSQNIVIAREIMGKVMKKRGIKREGDGAIRIGKKVIKAWWFTEDSLIEHGLDSEEWKIPVIGGSLYENL